MSFMRVVIRATGLTATILSFASLVFGQTRVVLSNEPQTMLELKATSEEPPTPPEPPPVVPVKKRNIIKRMFAPKTLTATPPTPVGVRVMMSDGTEQTYPLGIYLQFQNGVLRGIFPTQYVNQIATMQDDGTWKYTRPGRNVQVWRNGLLQRQGPDYTLNQAGATITPVKYPGSDGIPVGWNSDDYVTVAYLY